MMPQAQTDETPPPKKRRGKKNPGVHVRLGSALTVPPSLQTLPMSHIQHTIQNPRTDPDDELDALVASLDAVGEPMLAQPPLVKRLDDGTYQVIAGSRRLRAAVRKGWQMVACLVYEEVTPAQIHMLRLAENLQRRPLHALDEAIALKNTWLFANAEAVGQTAEAQALLGAEQTPAETMRGLLDLLEGQNWSPTHPAVTWDTVLDQVGLAMNRAARNRLLRLLSLEPKVQATMRELDLSEASMRALGTLTSDDQQRLVEEMVQDPRIAAKGRRIARTVRDKGYSMDQALAEARGQVYLGNGQVSEGAFDLLDPLGTKGATPSVAPAPVSEDVSTTVMRLVQVAGDLTSVLDDLKPLRGAGPGGALPEPWGDFEKEALHLIHAALEDYRKR